jgi:hypothetical protein
MKQIGEFAVYFFVLGKAEQFAFRRLGSVPRNKDICVFNEKRYLVDRIEWCLDNDATECGTRINVELTKI